MRQGFNIPQQGTFLFDEANYSKILRDVILDNFSDKWGVKPAKKKDGDCKVQWFVAVIVVNPAINEINAIFNYNVIACIEDLSLSFAGFWFLCPDITLNQASLGWNFLLFLGTLLDLLSKYHLPPILIMVLFYNGNIIFSWFA